MAAAPRYRAKEKDQDTPEVEEAATEAVEEPALPEAHPSAEGSTEAEPPAPGREPGLAPDATDKRPLYAEPDGSGGQSFGYGGKKTS